MELVITKKYFLPGTIEEAVSLAGEFPGTCRYIAGGTDLWVNRMQENEKSEILIDLSRIESLKKISQEKDRLTIGSMVTLEEIMKHSGIAKKFPALIRAASVVGTPLIRKSATVGGNLLCENRCSYYN
jgi:CO/xanthine dehydrogenase FAD-binding subunit